MRLGAPEKDAVVNIGSEQQVKVMSMEDDEFSSGAEDVSSLNIARLLVFFVNNVLLHK